MTHAYLVDGVRTPIGRYGGALATVRPDDLAAHVLRELTARHPGVDWAALADASTSLVVLTGRAHQGRIAEALTTAGLPAATPAAVVHGAGRPGTEVRPTTVAALGSTRLPPPALVVVGPDPVHGGATTEPGGDRAHP